METDFTRHAQRRIHQRTSMSNEAVKALLDGDNFSVPFGVDPGSHRESRMFYSIRDDSCFIAIRDIRTKEVVTVLPIEYHGRFAVPPDVIAQVTLLVAPERAAARHGVYGDLKYPRSFRLMGFFKDQTKPEPLGVLHTSEFGICAQAAVHDPEFKTEIQRILSERKLVPAELERIEVHTGAKQPLIKLNPLDLSIMK